jgi:TRAP-type transport system small permease protein
MERPYAALLRLSRVLAVVGLSGLLLLAVLTLADGLLRSLANRPIDAVRDLGGVVAAMSVACCLPLALLERSNIVIRFADAVLGRRAGAATDKAAAAFVLVVVFAMAREFFRFASAASHNGDATWILNIPTAPFWFVVDALIWLAVLAQAAVTVRLWRGIAVPVHGELP